MIEFLDSIISEPLKDLYSGFKDKATLWKELKYNLSRYITGLGKELDEFTIHRANRFMNLTSMYVELKLIDKILSEHYFFDVPSNPEVLEYMLKRNPKALIRSHVIEEKNYKTIYELIPGVQKLIILGQPGSGKTTILKKIVIDIASGSSNLSTIPVYIPLRNSALRKLSMKNFIEQQFEKYGIGNSELVLNKLLEKGKLILLFDGIDEIIDEERQRVIEDINNISIEYPLNLFIATSRISSYHGELLKFKEVEMCEFTLSDITSYIDNWFRQNHKRSSEDKDKLIENINKFPQIEEIANSPLLLSLICVVYDFDLQISPRRTSLYRRCIECLMRDWDAQRGFRRETNFSKLDELKRISILSNLAYNLHLAEKIYFDFYIIENHLSEIITMYGLAKEDTPLIIREIIDHCGLLIEVSKNNYSFSHLTFQEYFAANYISEKRLFGNSDFIFNFHPFWEEVNILCASILPDATEYLNKLLNSHSNYPDNILLAGLCLSVDPVVDLGLKERIVNSLLELYHNYKTKEIHQRAKYCLSRIDDTLVGRKILVNLGITKFSWNDDNIRPFNSLELFGKHKKE